MASLAELGEISKGLSIPGGGVVRNIRNAGSRYIENEKKALKGFKRLGKEIQAHRTPQSASLRRQMNLGEAEYTVSQMKSRLADLTARLEEQQRMTRIPRQQGTRFVPKQYRPPQHSD